MKISNHTRNPNMTRTTSDSTSILAKLLAREDLHVVFSPSADTAYFNGATRTLTLPVWQNMSDELTEMLVSHEVGHALHTPAGEAPILDAIRSIDPAMSAEAKSYINIAEDARIEQEIKSEFPGTRKTFAVGYRDLLDRNMFDLDSIPMNQRTLCDRINIHAKVGFSVDVPFDAYEREILDAVMNAKSWEDVVENAKAMWEYDGTIGRKKIENAKAQNSSSAPGSAPENSDSDANSDNDGNADGNADGEGDSQDSQNSQESGNSDSQKSQDSQKSSGKTGEKAEKKSSSSAESSDDDKNSENDKKTGAPSEFVKEFTKPGAPASQAAIQKGLDSLRNRHEYERMYGVLPTPNLSEDDGIIIPFKKVLGDLGAWMDQNISENPSRGVLSTAAYTLFRRENDKQVSLMVREFERRRAANNHRRTQSGTRGIINVNRLHTYKFSEDIFKTYSVTKDGKSHGMVMFVDWSSSMSSVIGDTINQTLSLAAFCRKAGIPFEVYGFSSQHPDNFRLDRRDINIEKSFWSRNTNDLNAYGFTLLNLLSSRMSKKEFETMSQLLISFTDSLGGNEFVAKARPDMSRNSNYNYRWVYSTTGNIYGLGGTPLHSAIIAAHELLPKFRAETRSQILTTIFLTDGEGTDAVLNRRVDENGVDSTSATTGNGEGRNGNSWSSNVYARHRSSRESFKIGYGSEMRDGLIESLRRTTGSRILGFNILHSNWKNLARIRRGTIHVDWQIRRWFSPIDPSAPQPTDETLAKLIDKAAEDGVLTIPYSDGKKFSANPYDELYILSSKSMAISDGDEMNGLGENPSLTKIRNAFLKQNSTGRKSRVFLNRFIPMIAESI